MARKPPRRSTKDSPRKGKKKVCVFCTEGIQYVDYKDVNLLRRYMSERAKIRARRVSGNCAQHQREVAIAIKTARELALLPYTQRMASESRGPRVPRGPRPDRDERSDRSGDASSVTVDEMPDTDDVDAVDADGNPDEEQMG